MLQPLEQAENIRRNVMPDVIPARKAELGQYLTPSNVARFMAKMFPKSTLSTCRLLDAGAGAGALSCAFLERWMAGAFGFDKVEATAYEMDDTLRKHLIRHMESYEQVQAKILGGDYIEWAVSDMFQEPVYTHAILNPPYKKINSQSFHRQALRSLGIETVNLYAAFVALAIRQSAPGGQIVAIIPRSFCNGPYYRAFRNLIFERTAIRHIHLFGSRSKTFRDDKVLQENIIIRLEKDATQGSVVISTSTDDSFDDIAYCEHPFNNIVSLEDTERFIHIPESSKKSALDRSPSICYALSDLGINASTGPVVDFRMKEHLRQMPESGAVPLIYPGHFKKGGLIWPLAEMKKPNAIMHNQDTAKWLYPSGFYCLVRRFSSKEEKRRIVASIIDPSTLGNTSLLGFENHLNLFHENKKGLSQKMAYGLMTFLNSTLVDESFRRFNGHTQVNVTDLKQMKYPSRQVLMELGEWALTQESLTQTIIDQKITTLIA